MRLLKKRRLKTGMPPGSMVYVGEPVDTAVCLQVLTYDTQHLKVDDRKAGETDFESAEQTDSNQWVRVKGVHDQAVIRAMGERYAVDDLILEDVLNTDQRPRLEARDSYTFFTLRVLMPGGNGEIAKAQISFLLFPQTLVTFEEGDGLWMTPLFKRLESPSTRLRRFGVDYLMYAILDLIVDYYMECIEHLETQFEFLEETVIRLPEQKHVEQIFDLKQQSLQVRQAVRPVRDNLTSMLRSDTIVIKEDMRYYYNDLNDHLLHVIDHLDAQRELNIGLMDTYMSAISQRMNEVMKVLTVIATLFIPLSFFAGVYGMNFQYMPELEWRYAYPLFWGVVVILLVGLILFFKRKRWI